MARLASEEKGGYYPTPPDEMNFILRRITADEGDEISLLDPCCGEGTALLQMADHLSAKGAQVKTYGIEIEKTKGEKAEQCLDYVLKCGYEDTRTSNNAFSCLYLNPPYMQLGPDRAESIFFRDLTKPEKLPVGALVILVIPQYVLYDMAKLISLRLEDIKIYRFSDRNYDQFKQIVVYGYRKKPGKGKEHRQALEDRLKLYAKAGKNRLTTIDTPDWEDVQFKVPAQSKPVTVFESTVVTPEDIQKSINESGFFEKADTLILDADLEEIQSKRPAMPLKVSHYATAIAAGALPEHMGDHLLVGVTKRVQEFSKYYDAEKEKTVETTSYRPVSLVRVFSEKGIFDLTNDNQKVVEDNEAEQSV